MKPSILTTCILLTVAFVAPSGWAKATAATAETRHVNVNGNKIGYRSFGSGSPLLVANRMRGTLDTWDPVFLDRLAEAHTVVTFDYPGIGYSTGVLPTEMSLVATFVKDLAAELKLGKFAVLGWSWGGYLAQTLVLDYPDLVTHAVLIGNNPPGKAHLGVQTVWLERALRPVNDLADEEILFFDPKSAASLQAAKASRDRIYARPGVAEKLSTNLEDFHAFLKGHAAFVEDKANRRAGLGHCRTPMLIICGDNDASVPVENWFPFIGVIPRGQFVVLPQAGHAPQHQYPELSAEYVIQFLKHSRN